MEGWDSILPEKQRRARLYFRAGPSFRWRHVWPALIATEPLSAGHSARALTGLVAEVNGSVPPDLRPGKHDRWDGLSDARFSIGV
jgi:hypothetical protein